MTMSSILFPDLSRKDLTRLIGSHSSGRTTVQHGVIKDLHAQSKSPFIRCVSEALHQLGLQFESELVEGKTLEDTLQMM